MITIFHGDNFVLSRKVFNEQIDEFKGEKIRFTAKKLDETKLTQSLESNSLFGDTKLVIIENLLTLPRSKAKDKFIELVLHNKDSEIVLWEKKAITPAVKKKFAGATIKEFKLPASVFKVLDSLKPGSGKVTLKLLHDCLKKDAAELVFYMLHRRVSQLIQATKEGQLKGAPWQIGKLKSQSQNFKLETLLKLHQDLLNIDFTIKTGQAVLPLASQLDLLLINI
jgi:DNA polymerase III delta subunit